MKKLLLSFALIAFIPMFAAQRMADQEQQEEIEFKGRHLGYRLQYLKDATSHLNDEQVLKNLENIAEDIFEYFQLLKIDAVYLLESLSQAIEFDLSQEIDFIRNTLGLTDDQKSFYLKSLCKDSWAPQIKYVGKDKAFAQIKDFYEWFVIKNLTKDFKFAD